MEPDREYMVSPKSDAPIRTDGAVAKQIGIGGRDTHVGRFTRAVQPTHEVE